MMQIDTEAFGRELDAIQLEVKASLGASDRRYIQRVIKTQRALALGYRRPGLVLDDVPAFTRNGAALAT